MQFANSVGSGIVSRAHATIVRKPADQTVNNSTVLVDDTSLVASLLPNEIMVFLCFARFTSSAVADIKFGFTAPSGAVISRGNAPGGETENAATEFMSGAAGNQCGLIWGTVINGTTAGNFQVQFAQNTAEISDTVVLASSFLLLFREGNQGKSVDLGAITDLQSLKAAIAPLL